MGSIDFVSWKQLIQGNSNDRNIIYLRRIFFAHFYTPWLVFRTLITKDYWRRSRRLPLLLHIFAPLYYCSPRSLLKGPRKNRSRRTGVKTGFKRKKNPNTFESNGTRLRCGQISCCGIQIVRARSDEKTNEIEREKESTWRAHGFRTTAKRRKRTNGRTDTFAIVAARPPWRR